MRLHGRAARPRGCDIPGLGRLRRRRRLSLATNQHQNSLLGRLLWCLVECGRLDPFAAAPQLHNIDTTGRAGASSLTPLRSRGTSRLIRVDIYPEQRARSLQMSVDVAIALFVIAGAHVSRLVGPISLNVV